MLCRATQHICNRVSKSIWVKRNSIVIAARFKRNLNENSDDKAQLLHNETSADTTIGAYNTGNNTYVEKKRRLNNEATKRRLQRLQNKKHNPFPIGCWNFKDFDEETLPENYSGNMDVLCKHCFSKNFADEKMLGDNLLNVVITEKYHYLSLHLFQIY